MGNAVIILAGGLSKRFGQDKCLREIAGKPLAAHVLDRVASVANDRLIVVGSESQRAELARVRGLQARIVVDKYNDHSPLIGALTGFENVSAGNALLLPCDAAFVSSKIATLLLDLCANRNAVIPRWPDGKIEPLQAAYDVKRAAEAARKALNEGKRDMISMIGAMRGIRYVSTLVLQQYDSELASFFNINTVDDWKRAEAMLKGLKRQSSFSSFG